MRFCFFFNGTKKFIQNIFLYLYIILDIFRNINRNIRDNFDDPKKKKKESACFRKREFKKELSSD